MRLASEILAAAIIRRASAAGAFATLARRGAAGAGSILIRVDRRDGTGALYGPAPQSLVEGRDSERLFQRMHAETALPLERIDAKIAQETRFDPDLWLIDVEDREGRPFAAEASGKSATSI
jgi:hypothetical protein